jgi:hypothetical protein
VRTKRKPTQRQRVSARSRPDALVTEINRLFDDATEHAVQAHIRIGEKLIKLKKSRPGTWLEAFQEKQIRFSIDAAERFMQIARYAPFKDSAILRNLPPSRTTLAALTKLDPKQFKALIADNADTKPLIYSDMTYIDAANLLHRMKFKVSNSTERIKVVPIHVETVPQEPAAKSEAEIITLFPPQRAPQSAHDLVAFREMRKHSLQLWRDTYDNLGVTDQGTALREIVNDLIEHFPELPSPRIGGGDDETSPDPWKLKH